MFSYLMALAARLAWRDFGGLPPEPPEDPFADIREPRRSGPGGKSATVAVAEPDEPQLVQVKSRSLT